jgi:MFS family permease
VLRTTFQSLGVRNYRLFWGGQLVKLIGVWMQFIAQDWLVLELTDDSAYALGLVTALQFTPILLLTLYGGKLADRYDKRTLIIASNAILSVLALGLGLLVATGYVTVAWVFVFAALIGVVNAIETPVRQAFVSEMVSPELLPNALSLSAAAFNTARVTGPAIAGVAIAALDTGPVFLLNTVTYLAPMVALLRMRVSDLNRAERPVTDTRVRDGLRYLVRREDLLVPIVLLFIIGMVGFNFQLTLAVLAKTVFNTGPTQFGLFSTALALGALGGALAGTGRRSRPSVYVVIGAAIGFGALEFLVGLSPTFWTTALVLVPTGFFMIYFAQATNQRIQLGTEAAYRGRVMAIFVLVFLGTTPIGGPVIGALSERYGPRMTIWAGGLASLVAALAVLVWQLRRSGARLAVRLRPQPRLYVIPLPREPREAPVAGLRHGEQETAGVPASRLHAST